MSNPIYDLMYRGESGAAGYNAYNRGTVGNRIRGADGSIDFSSMTLGQVMDLQALPRQDPDRLFAVGKCQIIPTTMRAAVANLGLDRDQPFAPELQDRIFSEYLIRDKQPAVRNYIEGRPGATLLAAQVGLAGEWASFGDPTLGGRSQHGGANRAHISPEETAQALTQLRNQYQVAIDQGMSRDDAWRAATAVDPAQRTQRQAPGRQPQANAMADGVLQRGERGEEVLGLQRSLNTLAITDERGQPLETRSGIYGRHTEATVRKFQHANGLEPTGVADKGTLEAIGKQLTPGKLTAQADVTGPVPAPATGPLITDPQHPNHKLFAEIGRQLPPGTRPEAVANITLQAVENGVTTADRLARVDIRGSDVFVQGTVPGNKVKVDVEAPTPTLQQMSDHLARQTQAQEQERVRSLGMQTPTLAA